MTANTHAILRPLAAALVALSLVACATSSPKSSRPVRELPPRASERFVDAEKYGGVYASETVAKSALRDLFEETARKALGEGLTHDAALDQVGIIIAEIVRDRGAMPADGVIPWLYWRFGITAIPAGVQVISGPVHEGFVEEKLKERAAELKGGNIPLAYGLGEVNSGGTRFVALVIAQDAVRFDGLSMKHVGGESLTLSGRFSFDAEDVTLHIEDEGRKVRAENVTLDGERRFSLTLPAPTGAGRHFIELVGFAKADADQPLSRRWRHQYALVPLYIDADPPNDLDTMIKEPPPNPTETTLSDRALELLNVERERLGLSALAPLDACRDLADGVAAEYAASPEAPPATAIAETLAERGTTVSYAGVRVGSFEYVDEHIYRELLSPSFRKDIMRPDVKRACVATTSRDEHQSSIALIYVSPVGKLDPVKEQARLFEGMNRVRESRGLSPLAPIDAALQAELEAFTVRVCTGDEKGEDGPNFDALFSALKNHKESRAYKKVDVNGLSAPVLLPDDLRARPYRSFVDSDATHLGVGVCQGRVGQWSQGEYVVFVSLWKR